MECALALGIARATPKLLPCPGAALDGATNHGLTAQRASGRTTLRGLLSLCTGAFMRQPLGETTLLLEVL